MKLKGILAWLLIGSIFIDNIYIAKNIGFDFRIHYILFVAAIPIYLIAFPLKVKPKFLLLGSCVCAFLFLSPLISGTPLLGSVRQLILIITCALPFYCLFNSYDYDVLPAFRIYLFFSKFISFLAIAQFIFLILKFKPGYDYSYLGFNMERLEPENLRVQAWMEEPSFLAYVLVPALFYYLVVVFNQNKLGKKTDLKYAVVVVVAMLLTRSLIAYVSIVVSLSVIVLSKYSILRKPIAILGSVFIIVIFSLLAYQVPAIKERVDDTLLAASGQKLQTVNISVFYFFNNLNVVRQSIEHNPVFGTGFGNYYVAYDKYAAHDYDANTPTPDGASLLFRLLTETGIVFTFLYVFWVVLHRMKLKAVSDNTELLFWVINNGVFVLIIMRLIRLPHYTALGFPFFIFLFYFSYTKIRSINSNTSDFPA